MLNRNALMCVLYLLASSLRTSDSVLCEVGEALKDPNNSDLDRTCGNGCPNNYYCVQSPSVQVGGVCCRTRTSACQLPLSQGATCGTGTVQTQRYYFDPLKSMCCPFYYNGCLGNLNNFPTSQECVAACRGTTISTSNVCPAGSTAQAGTTSATPCNQTPFMQCQTQQGYACTFSPTLQRSYCCSNQVVTQQFCPAGSTPQPGTTVNTPCQPGFACGVTGYTCQRSPSNGFNYCCSSNVITTNPTSSLCPQGGQPVMVAGTNNVVQCTNGACTSPFACQFSILNGVNIGVCCANTIRQPNTNSNSQDCPSGYLPYRTNNRFQFCNFNGASCPQGTNCLWSPTQHANICCQRASRGRKLGVSGANSQSNVTIAGIMTTPDTPVSTGSKSKRH